MVFVVILIIGVVLFKILRPTYPFLHTATFVDLKKYAGTWYEVALIPNKFEKGCSCTKAEYTLAGNYIKVKNSCYKQKENKYTVIEGKAWPVDKSNAKLKVQFYWPFRGDYWVLYVDKNYKYAIVGNPSRKYLWFLARQQKITKPMYNKLVLIAKKQGFDTNKLFNTLHNCHKRN
jgi:apolipoprotein D and lipocalin family protein